MKQLLISVLTLGVMLGISACDHDNSQSQNSQKKNTQPIFTKLSPQQSGLTFSNNLKEDSVINYFTYPYIYMGGGVAVGDLNNDGLQDLYFTGNMVENALFLNKGDLQFKDITAEANVGADDRWVTGVSMADVNADGWLDIYVSVSGKFATTQNLLYLNEGTTKGGIPTFKEAAKEAGIADEGHSTQGVFFDYDKDGDLDLYVANYPYTSFKTRNFSYQYLIAKKEPVNSDKLFRNKGDGTFEDVTEEAGLLNFGLSLSATVGDVNQDGWEDIYVSNDFATPDFLYLNNGDGTFKEKVKETTQHISFFGMGTDIADINNDGLLDILQMDMTPEDNRRNKANMASMNIAGFWEVVNLGMHYQYMQNSLQINNGTTADGLPHFSDITRMAGMSSTDWSWAGLMADFDNDGWKDVFITNGTRRDINNKDYFKKVDHSPHKIKKEFNNLDLTLDMPSERIDNYAFKNNGDLTFEPVVKSWGLSHEGFSNGAAYADLDNDGDLDLVVNNIDEASIIYQNKTSDQQLANFLRVNLKGTSQNPQGIGAEIRIKNKKGQQLQHVTPIRGFQSSVESVVHFGIGDEKTIEELTITWTDGKQQVLENIAANQVLTLDHKDATEIASPKKNIADTWFADATEEIGITYKHVENNYNDFQREVLLPHAYSKNGPGLAVGDVNGDNLEDFYVGAAIGSSGVLYLQNNDGTFRVSEDGPWKNDADKEDMGATLFDADGDGDLDLYVVSGGNEQDENSPLLQDRLYVNDGKAIFTHAPKALPNMRTSGSRVKPGDYDGDGDLDLFVGGRIVPGSYPLPAKSYILRNEGNLTFTDVTKEVAPELLTAGLVTDAVWADFNKDKKLDLVVVGEWMPLTFLQNTGNTFENKTEDFGLEKSTGWWYSIIAEDFDKDGDLDFVAGNLGLNYKYQATPTESFDVYAFDYDRNNNLDIVLGYYNKGVQYPVRGKQCSSEEIPAIKYKYKDYNTFASATLEDVYTAEDLKKAIHYQVWNFASSYVENQSNGKFEVRSLPNAAQTSSINGMVAEDINGDGNLDLVAAGNLFSSEVETPRNDASYGWLLEGDGKGNFTSVSFSESGLFLNFDTRELMKIETPQGMVLLAAANNAHLKAIAVRRKTKLAKK